MDKAQKIKRRSLTGFLTALALWAKANLVVAILIFLFAAVIVYILYQIIIASGINNPQNGSDPTNQVDISIAYRQEDGNAPPPPPSTTITYDALVQNLNSSYSFNLQYGVGSSNVLLPWLMAGQSLPTNAAPSTTNFMVTVEDDSYYWTVILVNYGAIAESQWSYAESNENFWGKAIVIQRSTDCVNWMPIFTNTILIVDQVNDFTDSNAPAPAAFYRVNYQ
jgi:hypothetical protein